MNRDDTLAFKGAMFASMIFMSVSQAIGEIPEKVNWSLDKGKIQMLWFGRGFEVKLDLNSRQNAQAGVMTGKSPPVDMVARVEAAVEDTMTKLFGKNIERGVLNV